MGLYDALEKIETRQDFVEFVHLLLNDLQENPDDWENPDLPFYLDALAAWTQDMDGVFRNRGEEPPTEPTWQLFAESCGLPQRMSNRIVNSLSFGG